MGEWVWVKVSVPKSLVKEKCSLWGAGLQCFDPSRSDPFAIQRFHEYFTGCQICVTRFNFVPNKIVCIKLEK